MIKKREKKQIKKRNREKGKRRKKEGDKFARPKNFLFRPNCVFDTLARAERRSTNRAAKRTDEEMYTQKGRKFRAVSLRLDALDGKQCRESWRENFFFLSFFFFFFFLEYDYCHGVAHLERYSIILQIARNDTLWRGPQELGAQRVIDKRERAAQLGFAKQSPPSRWILAAYFAW